MSTWWSSEDAFVRLGKTWVRQSAVVVVEPTTDGGTRIHLDNEKTILVNTPPGKVVDALVGRGA